MKTIELKFTGAYRDGGSKGYKDKDGNEYWRNYGIGTRDTPSYAKLYKGNINDSNPQLAVGKFLLSDNNETIKQ